VTPLPPAEFNPTLQVDELTLPNEWRVSVLCFGKAVGQKRLDIKTRPNRDWARVVQRWARIVINREYRRWLASVQPL
jgi:hypothetical protein